MMDTETWEQYLTAHTMTGDPSHDIDILISRMETVLNLQGAPDRQEVARWITALRIIGYDVTTTLTKRKWFRR